MTKGRQCMKTLSPESERQILQALEKVCSLVSDASLSPNAAMTKVAGESKWGPDMVRFASRAYNTGMQTSQYKAASATLDRLASFPLCDAEVVIDNLYGGDRTKAASVATTDGISGDYSRPPRWLAKPAMTVDKAAADQVYGQILNSNSKSAGDEDESVAYGRLLSEAQQRVRLLKSAAELARVHDTAARQKFASAVDVVSDVLRRSRLERPSAGEVRDFLVARYPEKIASALYDLLTQTAHLDSNEKAASAPRPVDVSVEPWQSLHRIASRWAPEMIEASTRREEAEKLAADAEFRFACLFTPDRVEPSKRLRFKEASVIPAKVAYDYEDAVRKTFGTADDRVRSAYNTLNDPRHDSKLRAIRSSAVLAEMLQDPVIKGHDPEDVVSAYNEISMMAPRASLQPMAVRTLLRRQMQSHVAPFEVQEVANLEKGFQDTNAGSIITPTEVPGGKKAPAGVP